MFFLIVLYILSYVIKNIDQKLSSEAVQQRVFIHFRLKSTNSRLPVVKGHSNASVYLRIPRKRSPNFLQIKSIHMTRQVSIIDFFYFFLMRVYENLTEETRFGQQTTERAELQCTNGSSLCKTLHQQTQLLKLAVH